MAFTEFYCDAATGSNINAGDNKTVVTSTNGDWGNAAANRFTAASGTPFSGVSVGDFASIYLDAATLAVYIGRVTAVNAGGASLDISSSAKSGTAPATGATGRTCTVGGKWKGPNGTVGFPFNFVTNALTDASSNRPRVNFKSGTNYSITAAMTHTLLGTVTWQGYTTTAGDGGRATIDGGTSGASYILLEYSGSGVDHVLVDLIFQNNGATGSATGLSLTSPRNQTFRCVVNSVRGIGFLEGMHVEDEAYACNQSNTSSLGAFHCAASSGFICVRCVAHDNTGANADGFYSQSHPNMLINCISDTNGGHGVNLNNIQHAVVIGLDSYNNGGSGIRKQGSTAGCLQIANCNLIKNAAYGIDASGASVSNEGVVLNCGYGSGTQANTSGLTNSLGAIQEIGAVTYASNTAPWVDAANGDFRINLASAKGAGRGTFTQTASSYTGAIGYPDIGAAQHVDSGSGGLLTHPGMSGGMRG